MLTFFIVLTVLYFLEFAILPLLNESCCVDFQKVVDMDSQAKISAAKIKNDELRRKSDGALTTEIIN